MQFFMMDSPFGYRAQERAFVYAYRVRNTGQALEQKLNQMSEKVEFGAIN